MDSVESLIERRAVKLVHKEFGIVGSKLQVKGDDGYPDRIFWMPNGKPFLVEYKREGCKLRPKQEIIHQRLLKLGYDVEVHYASDDTVLAVKRRMEAARISESGVKTPTK